MKKYFVIGVIILIGGVLFNYKLGGFDAVKPHLVDVQDYVVHGSNYKGSYKSNALNSLVDTMRIRQKTLNTEASITIINYIDEAKETLGIVSNFVGLSGVSASNEELIGLEKRVIKATKSVRIIVKIKPLVMPSPEKIKAAAFEFAEGNGLELQKLSIEQYSTKGNLVIDFPVQE
ncbi:MAG: hypothetical protein L3J06_00725 [Cyclobacteriaceae bacterium]|nr:hypothetical protein [Cyclobacteriaceae bacterium]